MENVNQSMKVQIIQIGIAFAIMITLAAAVNSYQIISDEKNNQYNREMIVSLNEISNLTQVNGVSPASEQIQTLIQSIPLAQGGDVYKSVRPVVVQYLISLIFMMLIVGYCYVRILRPFHKLEAFTGEIAKGNFDMPLSYERKNMFGAFTWAFDHMRKEIKKARSCEKEAIENNKTVIATLSHDIKTPIASIKAYAEGLEANMEDSMEKRAYYLSVIVRKCDEVTKLTNDLFLHSLSDLQKLQIESEQVAVHELLRQMVDAMNPDKGDLCICGEIIPAAIYADSRRLGQAFENIINNARKYAPGPISIWTSIEDTVTYEIHIKDEGTGILPEDMPFVLDKFYRGRNGKMLPGAGLGLYIVKYILEQMSGSVRLLNREDGLEVILSLPVS